MKRRTRSATQYVKLIYQTGVIYDDLHCRVIFCAADVLFDSLIVMRMSDKIKSNENREYYACFAALPAF